MLFTNPFSSQIWNNLLLKIILYKIYKICFTKKDTILVGSNNVGVSMLDSCANCMFDCMRSYNFNISMYVGKLTYQNVLIMILQTKIVNLYSTLEFWFSVQPVTIIITLDQSCFIIACCLELYLLTIIWLINENYV